MRRPAVVGSLLAALAIVLAASSPAPAAPRTAKVQCRVLAADTGEPLSAADVVLLPADSTLRPAGGFTHNDGTFLIEVPPGLYTLQVRALSYRPKRVTGLILQPGELLPLTVTVETAAIEQKEVVVEATRAQNTEKSMLVQRQRAATVGDAVSAEAVRRSPDKDAADVLRRVTGLSVNDGKYVYVRGMGERYSSTQIDGVRLVSPERNKRVVPLDLVPANLLENVVVQKTHSAERAGEFGGGDVQLKTKDFPGQRTLSFSASSGAREGTTFHDVGSYPGSRLDWLGWGGEDREIPDFVRDVSARKRISVRGLDPSRGFSRDTIALLGRSFRNVWTPGTSKAPPNSSFSQSFGDEWRLFGRPLGLIQSLTYSRSLAFEREERTLANDGVVEKAYDNEEGTETVQWGGLAALAYRLSPRHSLHTRAVVTRNVDDEARTSFLVDENRQVEHLRRTQRLRYVERMTVNGLVEGRHELPALAGVQLDWKLTGSRADRVEPDRRQSTYYFIPEQWDSDREVTVPERWVLLGGTSGASRQFEDQRDRGRGAEASAVLPLRRLFGFAAKASTGFSYDARDRDAFLRRFAFVPGGSGVSARRPSRCSATAGGSRRTRPRRSWRPRSRTTTTRRSSGWRRAG